VRDAIVQWLEANGRAFFRNAGATRARGAELGLAVRPLRAASGGPSDALAVTGAYTYTRLRFEDYRVQAGARVDTLDARTVPGAPERFVRVGLRSRPFAFAPAAAALAVDLDHTWASAVYADDRNTLRVGDWGRGVLDVRLRWDGAAGPAGRAPGGAAAVLGRLRPFAAVQNALGQRYVGAVTVNGANGRVFEPAPGRTAYVGLAVGAP
jgi:iron complex outermembrane receptor protein